MTYFVILLYLHCNRQTAEAGSKMHFILKQNKALPLFELNAVIAAFVALFTLTACGQSSGHTNKSRMVNDALKKIIAQENIPGMVAAISSAERLLASGAAGVRKAGTESKLTENDLIHIGSCTKAMTSVMLATFVADNSCDSNSAAICDRMIGKLIKINDQQ